LLDYWNVREECTNASSSGQIIANAQKEDQFALQKDTHREDFSQSARTRDDNTRAQDSTNEAYKDADSK
jgi:hypothetical protein